MAPVVAHLLGTFDMLLVLARVTAIGGRTN
jgi:hypothetical protein